MRTGRPKAELVLSAEQRDELERWVRRRSTAQALALRARIIVVVPKQSRVMVNRWYNSQSRVMVIRQHGRHFINGSNSRVTIHRGNYSSSNISSLYRISWPYSRCRSVMWWYIQPKSSSYLITSSGAEGCSTCTAGHAAGSIVGQLCSPSAPNHLLILITSPGPEGC